MLDFQLKQTAFRYGIAEGDDPHAVPFGVLTTLENYVWVKSNRVQKRQGVDSLNVATIGGAGFVSKAARLFTRNYERELCLFDGSTLFSYASIGQWAPVAAIPDVGLTQTPLLDPILGIQSSDTTVSGNLVVTATIPGDPTLFGGVTTANVSVCVTDFTTGSILFPLSAMPGALAGYGCRVITIGSVAIIVMSGADANIYAWSLNLSTMAVTGPTTLRADRNNVALANWNIAPIAGTSLFVLVYKNNAGGINLYSYNAALAVQANATQAAAVIVASIAVCATSGENLYVAYSDNTTTAVRAYVANPATMVTTVAPFTVEAIGIGAGASVNQAVGVCRYDAGSAIVVYSRPAAGPPLTNSVASRNVTNAGVLTAATARKTFGCNLVSAPFMLNGKCYAFAQVGAPGGGSVALTFVGTSSVLLNLYPGPDDGSLGGARAHPFVACADTLLGADNGWRSPCTTFTAVSSTRIVGSIPFLGTAPNSRYTWRCAIRLMSVTAGTSVPADLWRTVARGPETFISGPVLTVYDGADAFDYGFNYAPSLVSQATAGAGGLVLAGNYTYAGHLEFRGASGLLYRGPTVVGPALTTVGATSANTIVFGTYNVGNKRHATTERFGTSLPVYRTVVNGTIPQRLTEEPTYNTNPVVYEAGTISFLDPNGDAVIDASPVASAPTLASRPAIYTSGGTLDDQQPPSSITMFSHVDRLFVLAGDARTWWYSKSFGDDLGVAPGFNVAFRIAMPTEQVAGASMDDKAIFFGRAGVSYMLGTGPAKDGTASDFTTPVKVQTDVGCTNSRSLVSVPDGIMFQSLRGIYILTRNLDLEWIGRPVQDTLALFPNITSAVLVASSNEVRFTANNAAGSLGVVLIYNYIEKQWSTAKYFDSATATAGVAIADACIWNGAWCFVTFGAVVYVETTAHNLDVDRYAQGTIETAWNSAGGPIAYQAVSDFWVNGISNTDHDLTIQCAFDSDSTYRQSRTFPALSDVTSVGDFEEAKISIGTRRKCNAIRFKITDATPTTPGSILGIGKGPTFQVMGFRVGIKPGDKQGAGKKG